MQSRLREDVCERELPVYQEDLLYTLKVHFCSICNCFMTSGGMERKILLHRYIKNDTGDTVLGYLQLKGSKTMSTLQYERNTSRLGDSVDRRKGKKQSRNQRECNCAGLKSSHWGGLAW